MKILTFIVVDEYGEYHMEFATARVQIIRVFSTGAPDTMASRANMLSTALKTGLLCPLHVSLPNII